MSKIAVEWENEARTNIKYVYQQGWSWQDYQDAIKAGGKMLDEVTHPVNVIMDFHNAGMLPNGAISQVQKALTYPRHPNVNLTAIVGANTFIRTIAEVGQKLARKQNWDFVFVITLEEAHARFEAQAVKESRQDA
jgi:hypothetical protein